MKIAVFGATGKTGKLFLLLILLAGLCIGDLPVAWACSCAPPDPPAEALAAADAVFSGVVTASEASGGIGCSGAASTTVQFRVLQVWKGQSEETLTLTTRDGASCGYSFQTGVSYLVYAHRVGQQFTVSLCSRTQPLARAAVDLAALGQGASPAVQPSPLSPLPTSTPH